MQTPRLAALALLATAGTASANITAVGYSGVLIPRPANATQGVLTHLTNVYCWNEAQNFVLPHALTIDASRPGYYTSEGSLTPGSIPAGTRISSHYIHYESPNGTPTGSGISLQFDGSVLGVICLGDDPVNHVTTLGDSDFLGMGTEFPVNLALRGLEIGWYNQNDALYWWPDGNQVTIIMSIDSPGDFIRVITGPAPCYANCDGSTTPPVLNVLDFSCFLNKFAAGDPYANCDQSTTPPVLNVLDFSCFLNQFAAGCP